MPKDLPADVVSPPPKAPPEPFNSDAGGKQGGPTEMEVYARRGVNTQSVMNDLWRQAERRAREIVRAPRRTDPGGSGMFEVEPDTSDQMVLDVAVGLLQQDYADELQAHAEFIKDIYATESADIISKAPQMFLYGAVNLDWALNHSLAESVAWLSQQLGDTHTAAYLDTFMLSDDVSAIKTRALLADIAGAEVDTEGPLLVADLGSATASDLLQSILTSPDPIKAFRALQPAHQYLVQQLAAQISEQGEEVLRLGEAKTADALWVYGSGRYSLVLNTGEQGILNDLAQQLYSLDAGTTTDLDEQQREAARIGVDQLRAIDGGIIVLDEEWAKANPDKMAGIVAFLEQRYPEAQIQVGRQGIIGSVLDAIGEPADDIASFLGAGARQVSELLEDVGTSDQDRERLRREAARMRWELDNGQVPENEVDDTLHEIARLEEDATSGLGWDAMYADMERSLRNRVQGAGFGQLMAESLGVMPGDAGYEPVVGVMTLFGQIAFDPINYVLPIVRGASLAARIPLSGLKAADRVEDVVQTLRTDAGFMQSLKGLPETESLATIQRVAAETVRHQEKIVRAGGIPDAVHGIMTRRIYANLAKTPDQFIGTDRWASFVDHMVGLNKAVNNERIATSIYARSGYFSADHAALVARARNPEDMSLTLSSVFWPVNSNPNVGVIKGQVAEIDDVLRAGRLETDPLRLQAFANIETDLRARRAYLSSLLDSSSIPRDGVQLPTRRTIERIMQLGADQRKLPRGYEQMEDGLLKALSDDGPGWQNRFWFRMNHLWRQNGLGRELHFTGPQSPESIEFLQDFARGLQIPERRITEMLAPWLNGELRHDDDIFRWWENTWERMIKESPTLDAAGRERMAKWYTPYVGERTPSFISTPYERSRMTLPWGIRDDRAISGFPVIDADVNVNGGIRLPDARQMRQYQTVLGRSMNRMSLAGGGKRKFSKVLHGIGSAWYWFNDLWRSYILAGRPLSLGTRIFLEQQVRMAAYGYSSAFWHPAEYFRSSRWLVDRGYDQFLAFADVEGVALGSVADEMFSKVWRVRNRGAVLRWGSRNPDEGFFDALSYRMRMWTESHNYRAWLLPALDDPDDWASFNPAKAEELLRSRAGTEHGDFWINKLSTPGLRVGPGNQVQNALARSWEEVRQLLGATDDPELAAKLREMLMRGKANIDGTDFAVGTQEWAQKMDSLVAEGRWKPLTTEIPAEYGSYLPSAGREGPTNIASAVLRYTYSKPDIALSRAPLYRQVASREYNTLVGFGYSPAKAREVARFNAARRTSEMMFEIGVHTSGEAFWRNLNPFFPAWRELFTTWMLRVPMRLGGAEGRAVSWALGAGALTRRVNAVVDALVAGGALEVTPDGDLLINIGGKKISARSMFGILPIPIGLFNTDAPLSQRLTGFLPTLGAPATFTLGWVEKGLETFSPDSAVTALLENIEGVVAPYGTDVSLGPTSIDALLQSFGLTSPWMSGTTRELQNTMRMSAKIDGMRLWIKDNPRPVPPPKGQPREEWMDTVLRPWMAQAIAAGESYAKRFYLQKALLGSMLPFQFVSTPEGKAETEQLWADLAALRDLPHLGSVFGAVIDDFVTEHPDLESYLVGKYLDERETISAEEDIDSFFKAVAAGEVNIRSAEDWMVFMYGKSTIDFMQRRINAEERNIRETYGPGGFAEYMLDPNASGVLDNLKQRLADFRDLMAAPESRLVDGQPTFETMWYDYTKNRDDRAGRHRADLSIRDQQVLDAMSAVNTFDNLITLDPARSDAWYATVDSTLAAIGAGQDDDWWGQATTYFFDKVNGPYYKKFGDLIEQIDHLDRDDPKRSAIFEELRMLASEYNERRTYKGVELPTPEEYQFARWTPAEQRSRIAQWASLPPLYLTEFQREQVGYDVPEGKQDEINKLARFSYKANLELQKFTDKYGFNEDNFAIRDKAIQEFADEHGVGEYNRLLNVPTYRRIDNALDLSSRSATWAGVMHQADQMRAAIEAEEVSLYGGSEFATKKYNQLSLIVEKKMKIDPEFNQIMVELDEAFDGGLQDMVREVFFGFRPTMPRYAQGPLVHSE